MFIGDGAKLFCNAFQLSKEKAPCIIFIHRVDVTGTKCFERHFILLFASFPSCSW